MNHYCVLFLGRANAGRTLMAEALVGRWAPPRFRAVSAGLEPGAEIDQGAALALRGELHAAARPPRPLSDVLAAIEGRIDLVIALDPIEGDLAIPGNPPVVVWHVDDPRQHQGGEKDRLRAWRAVLRDLEARIKLLASLASPGLDELLRHRRAQDAAREAGRSGFTKAPMRHSALLLAAVVFTVTSVLFAAPARADASTATPPPPPAVKLLVTVAIDGVSWPRLEQARPLLGGGLKRMLEEGHVFTRSGYRHLNTETSPGHAALSTGAPPRVTGVVGNRWFVRAPDGTTKVVSSIEQPGPPAVPGQPSLFYHEVEKDGRLYVFANARELELWRRSGELGRSRILIGGGPGGTTVVFDSDDAEWQFAFRQGRPVPTLPPGPTIQGPAALRVLTLGDLLVQARPDSRVVSLSAKDRSAAFMAGRDPRHVVYWYDKTSGRLVTSTAYDTVGITGSMSKAIVDRFNRDRGGAQLPGRFGLFWKQLDGTGSRPKAMFDLAPYQIPSLGLGFDHRLDQFPGGYFEALYESGLVDEIVTDLVVTVIADEGLSLGRRLEVDALNVSLAAHDIVAHSYGVESAEADDAIRRVDRQLGRILRALDEKFAPGEVLVALSADHGFSPIPEVLRRAGETRTGGRLVTSDRALPTFQERVSRMLSGALCLDPSGSGVLATDTSWNLAFAGPFPLRTVEGSCGPSGREVSRAEMGREAKRLISTHFAEEVEEVLLVSEQASWPASPYLEMARNVLDPERIGDVILIPRPHALVHWDPARGSGHGSHHDYDTHVPLIFLGGGFARGISSTPVTPYDLAPTLGAAAGIELPQATGKSLLPVRP